MIKSENPSVQGKRRSRGRTLRVLSLFSGIGGLDLGFIQEGFHPVGAFDVWQTAIDVYQKNLASEAYVLDLSKNDVPQTEAPDVVIAGSPCQGFSVIGSRKLDDPRNSLYVRAAQLAVSTDPQAIVLENVPGVLAGKHKDYYGKAVHFLEQAQFIVHHIEISAQETGLPQRRKRVFLIATKTSRSPIVETEKNGRTLGQILVGADQQQNHDPIYLSKGTKDYEIALNILPGQKLSDVRGGPSSVHSWDIPRVFGPTTRRQRELLVAIMRLRRRKRRREFGDADPVRYSDLFKLYPLRSTRDLERLLQRGYLRTLEGYIDLARRFNGKYRRLNGEGISNTVDTRFGDPRNFLHPSQQRGISAREAARIQGFPDTFSFEGSLSEQFRMIGNAVPVPMARAIARAVKGIARP